MKEHYPKPENNRNAYSNWSCSKYAHKSLNCYLNSRYIADVFLMLLSTGYLLGAQPEIRFPTYDGIPR